MANKFLLIVESPAKARTIGHYLGNDFCIDASYGHVRDLPKSKMGVDTENNYEPSYLVPTKAKKVISRLKNTAKDVDTVYLATDPDREGEAIAWHLSEALGLGSGKKFGRVTFNSITKESVTEAVKNPREIDMHLVDAQQARRVIDRLVGYSLSPILWRKIYKGLSAGRVQSVAVRMVVERERERQAFKLVEYWSIEAELKKGESKPFIAILVEAEGKKVDKLSVENEKQAKEITSNLENATYEVAELVSQDGVRNPMPPFTTSSLQQEASNRFGWSAKQTMRTAQGLYEKGLITYMRTDSMSVAPKAIDTTRKVIENEFGKEYLALSAIHYKTKSKGAQEAHEAIRPTYPKNIPEKLKFDDERERKLYELIWRRMVASQMAPAKVKSIKAKISAKAKKDYLFVATGLKTVFMGWRKVYPWMAEGDKLLPDLKAGDLLDLINLSKKQHFTEPPARFTEASLIKALEEKGIGRPSTYAPTMSTIMDRGYVAKDGRYLYPEKVGESVNDMLVKHFPDVVDYDFTAKIEEEFDQIAENKIVWTKVVDEVYKPLKKSIDTQESKIEKIDHDEDIDEKCPDCGKAMKIKRGKYGRFIACTGYPDCKYTRPYLTEKEQALKDEADKIAKSKKCPKCSGALVARKGRFGWFIGCSKYPKCKYLENIRAKPVVENKK